MTFADEITKATSVTLVTDTSFFGSKLLRELAPSFMNVINTKFFTLMATGTLPTSTLRSGLISIFPLIQGFSTCMERTLTKVPNEPKCYADTARAWLSRNIRLERYHAKWFRDWAIGFGVLPNVLEGEINVPRGIAALDEFLVDVSQNGSFVEALAAVNFAVEGATGLWARRVLGGIQKYSDQADVRLTKKTLLWLTAHASLDDRHPIEALQIIENFATTSTDQERVKWAASQSLRHYVMAAETCMELFGPRFKRPQAGVHVAAGGALF